MEILLALAGITGLALLLAAGPLPSEADFKKAQEKLKTTPEDPDASTVVGKYLAFVQGNFDDGMKFLGKSSDKTLRTLAEHEQAPLYTDTAVKKVGIGDEWVLAAKTFPALSRIFYDRAASWYTKAWPELKDEPLWGIKLRDQSLKLSASRPPGMARKGMPSGWKPDPGTSVDSTIARVGSYSAKVTTAPKQELILASDSIPVTGKTVNYSGWVRSDGTDSNKDQIYLAWYDKDGQFTGVSSVTAPTDTPFWNYLNGQAKPPADAAFMKVGLNIRSRKGFFWVDDLSVKVDGKEVLKNGSFEDR